jgi:hypothetical protein
MDQNLLKTHVGVMSANLHDDRNSVFRPAPHQALAPSMRTPRFSAPILAAPLSTTRPVVNRWEINKEAPLVKALYVIVRFPGIGWSGAAGLFKRFCDGAGLHLLRRVELRHGSEKLQTLDGHMIWKYMNKVLNDQQYENYRHDLLLDVPAVDREIICSAPFELRIPLLCAWFQRSPEFAYSPYGLAQKLAVEIEFESLDKILQSNLTASGLAPLTGSNWTTDILLDVEYVHVNPNERNEIVALYGSEKRWELLFDDIQKQDTTIHSGSLGAGEYAYQVTNCTQPVHRIDISFHFEEDLNRVCGGTGGERGCDPYHVQPFLPENFISSIELVSNNASVIWRKANANDYKRRWNTEIYTGRTHGSNIYSYELSMVGSTPNVAGGSFDPALIDQLTLRITTIDSGNNLATTYLGTNSDIRINMTFWTYNHMVYGVHEIKRKFN